MHARPDPTTASIQLRIVKSWIVAAAVFGVATANFEYPKWIVIQGVLFALPLLALIYPSGTRLNWAFWGSVFLVLQALLSPFFIDLDFKTLLPNVREVVDEKAGIPGIHGQQVITTDFKGFRTTKTVDYTSGDSFRIFAIGASTTEQIFIDDQDTWTNVLQQSLEQKYSTNVEVVNTGVSGLRVDHHLATLRNIASLHPDVAVFLAGINDWNHQIESHFSPGPWPPSLKGIGEFRRKLELNNTVLGNAISRFVDDHSRRPRVYHHQRSSLARKLSYSFRPEAVSEEYIRALDKISTACKRYEIKCMFVTQPTGYQYSASEEVKKSFWMTPPHARYTIDFESAIHMASLYNGYLREFARRAGHYLCDAAAMLDPTYENLYDDCHFTTLGARRMGQIVSQCFQDIVVK